MNSTPTRFNFTLPVGHIEWLKQYAQSQGTSAGKILSSWIDEERRKVNQQDD